MHIHTPIPRNCRCFSYLLQTTLCRCPLYWFTLWHPFKRSYEIASSDANLQQVLAPGSFPHRRAWPLSTLGSGRKRGFKSFTHRASRCSFLTDSRRCSLWQDVPLTQRLTWQNRRSDWAASWTGTAYFCGIQEAQQRRNYFKCSQYLRASRALVVAQ